MPIFDHTHPKIIQITFSFPEFAPACKKSVHSINSFSTTTTEKFFEQLLSLCKLHQYENNQAISLISSGDIVDRKNPAI